MVGVRTAGATEALRRARARVDVAARRASLRAEGGGHLHQLAALPGELVAKHLDQTAPACIQNPSGESGSDGDHVSYLEALDDHRAGTLGVGAREGMHRVLALPADLAMQPAHAVDGLLPIFGTFLATGDDALSTGQALQCAFEVSRVLYEMAVGVAHQVTDASIEGHDRLGSRSRRRDFELA